MKNFWVCAIVLYFLITLSAFTEIATSEVNDNLRIITENFAPFNYKSKNGEIVGQSTEVVKEILARLHLDIDIELMDWARGYDYVQSSKNVAIFSTARTNQRENLFRWVGPIASDEYYFYSLKDTKFRLNSLEEVKKVDAVAVVKESSRHQLLMQEGLGNLKLYSSDIECYNALEKKEVELVLGSKMTKDDMCKEAGIEPSQVMPLYFLKKIPYYIAFNKKTSDEIVNQWQNTLNKMKNDGTYTAIMQRWNTDSTTEYLALSEKNGIPRSSALKLLTNYIDGFISEYLDILQALTFTNEVRAGNWQEMKSILVAREKVAPAGRIWYMLPDGSYFTTVDDLTSENLKDRQYFPNLMAGNLIRGELVVSKSTGRTVAVVAVPITDNNERVKGALGTSVYMQNVNNKVEQVFPLPGSQNFLAVTQKGIIALHSDESLLGLQVSAVAEELNEIKNVQEGECIFSYNGDKWKANWQTTPTTNWRIVIATKLH